MATLLPQFQTLSELNEYCRSETFNSLLEQESQNATEADTQQSLIDTLKAWEVEQKQKFHPEATNKELKELKQRAVSALQQSNENTAKQEEHRLLIIKIATLRDQLSREFEEYEKATQNMQRKIAATLNALSRGGRSNRAKRAGLLNKHAGRSKIEGANADKHGNALGTEFDLGVDGAFKGMEIIVIQLYPFTNSHTVKAFEKKGFSFQWFTSVPSAVELKKTLALETVCQLWIIGGSGGVMNREIISIIEDFHKAGNSLYIWGDNAPYIADANQVLKGLFGTDLEMFGNVPGGKVVHVREETNEKKTGGLFGNLVRSKKSGFVEHLVTTGLAHLFEGVTVASFDEAKITKNSFVPLMWGSDGNLITIIREADENGGAVMCDGAFTRLYCNVDDAGTIRYIINCACWLAIESLGSGPLVIEETEDTEEQLGYDTENACKGICSILWEPVPMVCLSVMELADPEKNTSDIVLNDPLAFGEENYKIVGRHLYGESTGRAVVDMGRDPYLQQNVVGLLPAVSLANAKNRNLFSEELCRVFMGHRRLFSAAQLLFVAVMDSMLHPERVEDYESETVEVIRFMLHQALDNFRSTPDFSDVGDKIPLIDAMQHFFTVAPEFSQISKSFSSTCLIARVLHSRSLVPLDSLTTIVRRSLLRYIVAACLRFVKEKTESNGNTELHLLITDLLYKCWNHIPLNNTGRIAGEIPSFITNSYVEPLQRFVNTCGVPHSEIMHMPTISFVLLLLTQKDLRSFKVESLLEQLLKKPSFTKFWNGELVDEAFVVKELNKKFTGFQVSESHKQNQLIPFATSFGPSVFRCIKCDVIFGDPNKDATEEYVDSVKKQRNKHFQAHLAADGNGYPTATSQHFSLHRSIQIVMATDFPDELEYQPEMSTRVARRLLRCKGNIHRENIDELVHNAIQSYLECRKRGDPHPDSCVKFIDRYRLERDFLLQSNK